MRDLPSCRPAARLDAGEHGSFRELLASQCRSRRRDGRCEVRHLPTENLVQGREQGDHSLIRNPVEDLLGLATRLDDAALTQFGELLRQAWLAKPEIGTARRTDRKSTRLNSSHQIISYAVFCLKKKKKYRGQ